MVEFSDILSPMELRRGSRFLALQFSRSKAPSFFDPVLNVDWFEMSDATFPPHPYAGFSAVTYLFSDSPGGLVVSNSLEQSVNLAPGSLYWVKAGGGIVHSEKPDNKDRPARGLQIFLNEPSGTQMNHATAFHLESTAIQVASCGSYMKSQVVCDLALGSGPCILSAPVRIEEYIISANGYADVMVPSGWGGIFVATDGVGYVDGKQVSAIQAISLRRRGCCNATMRVMAANSGLRGVLIIGQQLHQPIYQSGPIIMASCEALDMRVAAFRRGEFGSVHDAPKELKPVNR